MFQRAWAERKCPENFSAVTGEAFDQPDTDDFYGWGALMPFIALGERIDVSPWDGWSLARGNENERVGPIRSPWGALELSVEAAAITVRIDGRFRLATSTEGLTRLAFDGDVIRAVLPPGPAGAWIAVPEEAVRSASLDGSVVTGRRERDRLVFKIGRAHV